MDEEKLAALLSAAAKNLPPPDDDPTEEVETVEKDEEKAETQERPSLQGVTSQNLFRHPDAHPLVLDLALLKRYGPDFLLWEPETLEIRIPQDFHVSEVSDLNMAKVQACKTLHLVDTFWDRWEVFCWVTASLNGMFPDFESMQVPTVTQCSIAVDIAKRIRDDVEWSTEVKAFIEQVFRFEGIFCPQPPLDFVSIDTDGLVVDCAEVQKYWPEVLARKSAPQEETIVAEQLRRLLLVHQALEENRVLLRSQLPLVQHV
jgi:hypothetical protein